MPKPKKKPNQTYLLPREKANLEVLKTMLELDQSEVVALGLQILMEMSPDALERHFHRNAKRGEKLVREYDANGHAELPDLAAR